MSPGEKRELLRYEVSATKRAYSTSFDIAWWRASIRQGTGIATGPFVLGHGFCGHSLLSASPLMRCNDLSVIGV